MLRARDGHSFGFAECGGTGKSGGVDVLLIPELGRKHDTLATLANALCERGYHVLSMDNTGQMRNITAGVHHVPTFTPIDTAILDKLMFDAVAAGAELRKRGDDKAPFVAIGFGIGANLALLYAGEVPDVGVAVAVLPGHDCEGFNASDAVAGLGRRPMLLIESIKTRSTDLSRLVKTIIRNGNEPEKARIALSREPSATESIFGMDELVDWLAKTVPPTRP